MGTLAPPLQERLEDTNLKKEVTPQQRERSEVGGTGLIGTPPSVDVVVPVYEAPQALARCLESLLRHTDFSRHFLVLVADGPQPPETEEVFERVGRELGEHLVFLRQPSRRGFVAAVNRGMGVSDHDVVLLNSDTVVTARWLEKLQQAAYSGPRVASATPFSNSATICSIPRWLETNVLPSGWDVDRLGEMVERVSLRSYPRLPTGVGVCLYLKREALRQVGLFDEKAFGLGYGEESEWSTRALRAGWEHVLDDATFVYHEGQRSFGASRGRRVAAAHRVLRWRQPDYLRRVAAFVREDPLREARERVTRELARPRVQAPAEGPRRVVHVVHGWPPWNHAGAELYAAWLARWQAGRREVAVYTRVADPQRARGDALEFLDGGVRVRLLVNNFTQRDPLSRNALRDRGLERDFARFLDAERPDLLHVHHLAGHCASLVDIASRRGVPTLFQLQDWWPLCARANLLDRDRQLCSGPGLGKCSRCLPLTGLPPATPVNRLLYAYRSRLLRRAMRLASVFVAGSQFIHRSYCELGWLTATDPVHVIPYGVELEPGVEKEGAVRRQEGGPVRFGFIGSLLPHKGAHVAAAAFAGVAPALARLVMWGDPMADPAYTRELTDLAANGPVELRGRFAEADKAAIFAEIDVLIVPSLALESFGLVAQEAMAHGVPVVASERGALPETLAGPEAAFFDPERPETLRVWIDRLLADPGLVRRWRGRLPGVKGVDAHAEEIEEIYRQVLEGWRSRRHAGRRREGRRA
jgi:GT2 family glycosyltransferase